MKTEYILIGAIILTVIADIVVRTIKSKKKKISELSINNSKKRTTRIHFLYSIIISFLVSPTVFLIQDLIIYRDFSMDNFKEVFEYFFTDDIDIAISYFFISLVLLIIVFNYKNSNKINLLNYFNKRKKNTVFFIVSTLFLKVIINYIGYPTKTIQGINAGFGYYVENIFLINLNLFIYSLLFNIFMAWYFNDIIKAK